MRVSSSRRRETTVLRETVGVKIKISNVILKKCNVPAWRLRKRPPSRGNTFFMCRKLYKTQHTRYNIVYRLHRWCCTLTRVREYGLVVSVVEDVVPVAQREFFQIRDFGLVDDVLKTDGVKTYILLSIKIDRGKPPTSLDADIDDQNHLRFSLTCGDSASWVNTAFRSSHRSRCLSWPDGMWGRGSGFP